jgi:hypothetical protein
MLKSGFALVNYRLMRDWIVPSAALVFMATIVGSSALPDYGDLLKRLSVRTTLMSVLEVERTQSKSAYLSLANP